MYNAGKLSYSGCSETWKPELSSRYAARQAIKQLREIHPNSFADMTVAVWGLSLEFNSHTADESSLHALLRELKQAGIQVKLHDPLNVHNSTRYENYGDAVLTIANRHATLTSADALIIWNPCKTFSTINMGLVHQNMTSAVIIDMCNCYHSETMKKQGVRYYSMN